jgi:acetyl-CoA carboxylase biotin carboxyl carrier protein
VDLEKLKALLKIIDGTDVTRLDWEDEKERITIEKRRHGRAPAPTPVMVTMPAAPAPLAASAQAPASAAPAHTPAAAPAPSPAKPSGPPLHTVTSPFVGTFYRSSSPGAPAFVELGQTVKKGQVLCIVEAMKLMNEIEAEVGGKLAECLVQNGQPVEFGQALFRIEPA